MTDGSPAPPGERPRGWRQYAAGVLVILLLAVLLYGLRAR
jgi:hypothetical protein